MKLNKARKIILSIGVVVWHVWFFYESGKSQSSFGFASEVLGYLLMGLLVLIPTGILYFIWGERQTKEGKK